MKVNQMRKLEKFKVSRRASDLLIQQADESRGFSRIDVAAKKIWDAIFDRDSECFSAILKSNFLYPVQKISQVDGLDDVIYEHRYVRPIIEVLFFDYPKLLRKIIHLLVLKDLEEFYQAFIMCLANTDLIEAKLFVWDHIHDLDLRNHLLELKTYGKNLQPDHAEKGNAILNLVHELESSLPVITHNSNEEIFLPLNDDSFVPLLLVSLDNQTPSNNEKFRILGFKLFFSEILHSQDSILAFHRGLKKRLSNVATIILTSGIANIIHKAATNEWLFFNQTTSVDKISAIDHSLYGSKIS